MTTTVFDIDEKVYGIFNDKIKKHKIEEIRIKTITVLTGHDKQRTKGQAIEYNFNENLGNYWKPQHELFFRKEDLIKYLAK